MGIVPAPPQFGDNCLQCYPLGRTPKLLKVFIGGMQIGELWYPELGMPRNEYVDLLQDPDWPCWWHTPLGVYPVFHYRTGALSSSFRIEIYIATYMFNSVWSPPCSRGFRNEIDQYQGTYFYGGWAAIRFSQEMADLIGKVTPLVDPDPRMDLFPVDDEKVVVRYAGTKDATNIKIKFDTDLAYFYDEFVGS